MDALTISLKKQHAIVLDKLPKETLQPISQNYAVTLNAMMMELGYILSEDLFQHFSHLKKATFKRISDPLLNALKELKGAHVKHRPMYPNFPMQVMKASDVELFVNAILHYYSDGTWLPSYHDLPRKLAFEEAKYQTISGISIDEFRGIFTQLLNSSDSISAEDMSIIQWFLDQNDAHLLKVPAKIPFKENQCIIAAEWLKRKRSISSLVDNATDILRIATYMAGGDVSLAENTHFPSLPRSQRRVLTKQLERVISEEDIGRHRNKWVRLFHSLHVGEYSKKVYRIAKKARNGKRLKSFYSHLEAALLDQNIGKAVNLLKTRPGEFGRRLDHVLRLAIEKDASPEVINKPKQLNQFDALSELFITDDNANRVIGAFLEIVDKIPTRNLLQLQGHLNRRSVFCDERVVFPKGSFQNAIIVSTPLTALDSQWLMPLKTGIEESLKQRFAELASLGKVWIDPLLIDCPLPTQQRSASDSLMNIARGTRLPILGDKDTLRLFVYWVGKDIDLSATFHNEEGLEIGHVSYTNLKSNKYQAYHSGDIVDAPRGASEFIDISIPAAAKKARYLAMNVLVFNGPNFAEHDTCFVGWMTREKPNSNEIYEPKTVQQKLDLRQNCRLMIPVVFDLQERRAIWTDLPTSRSARRINNVENNRAAIQHKLKAIVNTQNKLSLYELFELHAEARGEQVENREAADIVFAYDGDISPYHVNTINSDYVVG